MIVLIIGVIKKDLLLVVFLYFMVNVDIFCIRNRIGFIKMKKWNFILKGNEEMYLNLFFYVG